MINATCRTVRCFTVRVLRDQVLWYKIAQKREGLGIIMYRLITAEITCSDAYQYI